MSAELFFRNHPPVPELKIAIEFEQEKKQSQDPAAVFLAHDLAEFASEGIYAKHADIIRKHGIGLDRESVGNKTLESSGLNITSLHFANTIIGLHNASISGFFDHKEYDNRLNKSVAGMPLRACRSDDVPDREYVDEEFAESMRSRIAEDPTFTSFFEDPTWIPPLHRSRLESTGLMNYFKAFKITEKWKQTLSNVVGKNSPHPDPIPLTPEDEQFLDGVLANF